jgi:two-component system sensor histidine kinase UhpB
VRTLAFELRPSMLDEFGLVRALRLLVERHGKRSGVTASFAAAPADARAPHEIETACFRIAQEALNNIASHAHAHQVEVTLAGEDNDLELMIRDDGVGFSIDQLRSSLGLVGMRERAELVGGRVDIESAPGAGTTLRARFPLSR